MNDLITRRLIRPLSLAAVLLVLPVASTRLAAAESGHDEHDEHTELGRHMEDIGRAWKQVRRSVKDPASNAENAKRVSAMIEHAKAGVDLIPVRAQDVPEAEREAFVAAYRKEMHHFIESLEALHAALAADDNAKAAEIVAQISKHQRASHKKFKPQDD